FDYQEIADVAAEILAEFGADVVIRNHAMPATYDPATGTTAPALPTNVTVKGVLMDFARGLTDNRGTQVQSGDKELLMEAGKVVPTPEDEVIIEGVTWSIMAVNTIRPARVTIAYQLHLHRG